MVDPDPSADPRAVRLSILGPAFSKILEQRNDLVLHASAVGFKGGAIVFVGASGSGKSSLAAAFCSKGHSFITDNLLVIRFIKNRAVVFPGFPQIKLFPDSAKALKFNPDHLPAIEAGARKRWVSQEAQFSVKPALLKRIYFLSKGKTVAVQNALSREKIIQLISHSIGVESKSAQETLSQNFKSCMRLARDIPMRLVTRSQDLKSLPQLVTLIQRDLVK